MSKSTIPVMFLCLLSSVAAALANTFAYGTGTMPIDAGHAKPAALSEHKPGRVIHIQPGKHLRHQRAVKATLMKKAK